MAVFFGALAMGGSSLPSGLTERVRDVLTEAGNVRVDVDTRVLLAYCDLALWPGPSGVSTDGSTVVVAGDPVLYCDGFALPRWQSLPRLLERLPADPGGVLQDAEGSFCGVRIDRRHGELLAFTDKLGVRPLYWSRGKQAVYVASAQWILDRLPQVPRSPDWQACTESAAFGYPLDDRTLNREMRVLLSGHLLRADRSESRVIKWWDWTRLAPSGLQGDALLSAVGSSFADAVAARVQGQRRVFAFLSGGMDSRLVVSRLRAVGAAVYSLNFAPSGSQDLVFGRRAAEVLGTSHFEHGQGDASFHERRVDALTAWRQQHPDLETWPEQPCLIWSGDGGSVGLGHVYLNSEILEAARHRGVAATAAAMQSANKFGLSRHVFRSSKIELATLPARAVADDLNSRTSTCVEEGRSAHLFFMLNDQRRHLAAHFEEVHRSRIDLVLPFFDGRFLSTVLSAPIDPFLGHRLYNRLMESLPDGSGTVPWQAYPGHEACSVPIPEGLRRQWEDGWFDTKTARQRVRQTCRDALASALSSGFPDQVLSRPVLFLAALAGVVGIDRLTYMTNVLAPFMRAASYANAAVERRDSSAHGG